MRRFGEPDTSLKAFGRLLWDALRNDFTTKIVVAMSIIVPALAVRYGRMDVLALTLVVYVTGMTVHYLAWRHLVKKGTWWLM